MSIRCIFGHDSVDMAPEKVGQFAFMYEQCKRCRKVRCTVLGMGGISTKKWESEEDYIENKRKQKEMDDRMAKSLEELEKIGQYRDIQLKKIRVNLKDAGQIMGKDMAREAFRRKYYD